jgi:hypothetical protein
MARPGNDTMGSMRYLHRLSAVMALLAGVAGPALADDCHRPATRPAVPDGAKATLDQFKAAHPAIQGYVLALDAYQGCMAAKIKQAGPSLKPDELQKLRADSSAALDDAKALSDAYQDQVKIFKTIGQGRSTGSNASH